MKSILIRAEDKNIWERRAPIVPEDLKEILAETNVTAFVQKSDKRFFPENENVRDIPAEQVNVKQGYLEQSNVNSIEEMVDLLITLRRFESLQKTIKTHDDSISKAVNELGRIT